MRPDWYADADEIWVISDGSGVTQTAKTQESAMRVKAEREEVYRHVEVYHYVKVTVDE